MTEDEDKKEVKLDETVTSSDGSLNLNGSTPPEKDPPIGELAYGKSEKNEKEIAKLREQLNNPQWSKDISSSISGLLGFIKIIFIIIFLILLISCIIFLLIVYVQFSNLLNVMEAIRDSKISNDVNLKDFEKFYFTVEKWIKVYVLGFVGLSGISSLGWFISKCVSKIKRK
jgi:hypothetical protein